MVAFTVIKLQNCLPLTPRMQSSEINPGMWYIDNRRVRISIVRKLYTIYSMQGSLTVVWDRGSRSKLSMHEMMFASENKTAESSETTTTSTSIYTMEQPNLRMLWESIDEHWYSLMSHCGVNVSDIYSWTTSKARAICGGWYGTFRICVLCSDWNCAGCPVH
jgi:hypothetical protein